MEMFKTPSVQSISNHFTIIPRISPYSRHICLTVSACLIVAACLDGGLIWQICLPRSSHNYGIHAQASGTLSNNLLALSPSPHQLHSRYIPVFLFTSLQVFAGEESSSVNCEPQGISQYPTTLSPDLRTSTYDLIALLHSFKDRCSCHPESLVPLRDSQQSPLRLHL